MKTITPYDMMLEKLKCMSREQLFNLCDDINSYETIERLSLITSEWIDSYQLHKFQLELKQNEMKK